MLSQIKRPVKLQKDGKLQAALQSLRCFLNIGPQVILIDTVKSQQLLLHDHLDNNISTLESTQNTINDIQVHVIH